MWLKERFVFQRRTFTFLPLEAPPLFLFFSFAGTCSNYFIYLLTRMIYTITLRSMGTFLAGGIFILGPSSRCPTSSHQPTWRKACLSESYQNLREFDRSLFRRSLFHWMNLTINLRGKCRHFHNPSTGRSPPPTHQSEL